MSLYQVQKLIYQLNRDPHARQRYTDERDAVLGEYDLTQEELGALAKPDIGLLYVLGVNGQLLMHFAALHRIEAEMMALLLRVKPDAVVGASAH